MVGDQRLCDACHYLGEKMVLRQAQFAANEAVRSTGLRAGARVGALFAAPGRSCRQASSCTMIRLRWPDRSASGKRDSSAQRQTAQNRLQARNGVRGDRNAAAKARQLRASWPSPGNLAVRKNAWWAREDSNLQPDHYEPAALTIGLRARSRGARGQRRATPSQFNADPARQPRRTRNGLQGCYLYAVCARRHLADAK
jgi:hypothetical protein